MTDNPFASAWKWTKEHTGSPLALAGLAGLGTYGLGRFLWGPSVETFRALGRPLAGKFMGGSKAESDRLWDEAMDDLKSDDWKKRRVPMILGALSSAGMLAMLANPGKSHYGLLSWNAPNVPRGPGTSKMPAGRFAKTESFVSDNPDSYVNQIDWNQPVNLGTAQGLFTNDPHLMSRPDAMWTGTAIVNHAALQQKTRQPTLGGIFDSAVQKFENKLSLGGVVDVGIKTAVANGAARLFTGALGAMCGLPDKARQTLVDAGTWAGAVTAILN